MGHIALIISFIVLISFSTQGAVFAQATNDNLDADDFVTTPGNLQPPQEVEPIPPDNLEPPDEVGTPSDYPPSKDIPPFGIYPQKDLNPFGLSTLGESTQFEQKKEGSTLGTDTKRKSNLEINKPRERKKTIEETEETVEEPITSDETFTEESTSFVSPSSLRQSGALYKWVDKDGVVHVTNSISSVPLEYRQQLTEEPQNAEEGF